jgi:hypothetical protein
MEIRAGMPVSVKTALGEVLPRVALTGIVQGGSFAVVWVCREEEWQLAKREGREPMRVPWPAEDVLTRRDSGLGPAS